MADRPHIVIFNPDSWRGDVLGHMGNPAALTPVLDDWVQTDAVSFPHAYCQSPVCTPSRCSFLTGWYPHVQGHRTMHYMLQPHEPMLLKTLKENGYFVWWGGKNDVVPAQNGFDAYCDVKYKPDPPQLPPLGNPPRANWRGEPDSDIYYSFYYGRIDKAPGEPYYYNYDWAMILGAIDAIRNAPRNRPFCFYLPLLYPHPPYAVEDPWYSSIDQSKLPPRTPCPENWTGKPATLKGIAERQHLQTWTEDRWSKLRATYYAMCARVDYQFGLVLNALREADMYDDTVIFFFSDHGDFTGDYGLVEKTQNTFEDCLTRVPLLIKLPASMPVRPGIRDALVELIDVSATLEAVTGIAPQHSHFGRSLLPLLTGEREEGRDAVFCEGGRLHNETQAMEVESSSSQNPQGLYWPRLSLQRSEGPEHGKATMCRTKDFKYVRRLYESDELYDLRSDPLELQNRIDDPSLAEVRALLKERMLTFYQETCDVVPHKADMR